MGSKVSYERTTPKGAKGEAEYFAACEALGPVRYDSMLLALSKQLDRNDMTPIPQTPVFYPVPIDTPRQIHGHIDVDEVTWVFVPDKIRRFSLSDNDGGLVRGTEVGLAFSPDKTDAAVDVKNDGKSHESKNIYAEDIALFSGKTQDLVFLR